MIKVIRKESPYKELARRIKLIVDDKEFFLGLASAAETEQKCEALLAYMDDNPDATAENIMVYALKLK